MKLGEKLKFQRVAANMTVQELSKLSGLAESTIIALEDKGKSISRAMAKKLSNALGEEVESHFAGTISDLKGFDVSNLRPEVPTVKTKIARKDVVTIEIDERLEATCFESKVKRIVLNVPKHELQFALKKYKKRNPKVL